MGGSLGYKKNFHDQSMRLTALLIKKIQADGPQAVITDCLSCRLQFQYLLPYLVYHPVEVLSYVCKEASHPKNSSAGD